jgi:hypothetical protein
MLSQVLSQPGAYAGGASDMVFIVPPRVSRVSCRRTAELWTGAEGKRRGPSGSDVGTAPWPLGEVEAETLDTVADVVVPRPLIADVTSIDGRPKRSMGGCGTPRGCTCV